MIPNKTLGKYIVSSTEILASIIERNIDTLVKLGVVLLVIGASIVFGYKTSPKIALFSLILVAGLIGFIFFQRRPELGIVLIIPISFFARWEIGTGTNIAFNITFLFLIAILGIWLFSTIGLRKPLNLQKSSVNLLSVIFLVTITIALIGGNIRWVANAQDQASIPAQVGGYLLYVLPICLILFMQAVIKDTRWLKIIVWVFIALGSMYIISLFPPLNSLSRYNIFIPRSIESMYWTWLAALAFGQFIFNDELRLPYRIVLGLLTLVILAAGLSASRREWTSGWFPPLLAIATIVWLRSWRFGLFVTALGLATLVLTKSSFINEFVMSSNQYSIYSRFATYPILFKLIQANPIIGLGFANYSHYTSLYPILGWYVSFNSHNNYMDIIAQTGFIGLIIFLGLIIAIGLRGLKLRKYKVDGFSLGYINACLGGLVGMLISGMFGDWFLPYLYNIGIPGFRSSVFAWIFIGGLLALGQIIDRNKSEANSITVLNPKF